MASSSKSSTQSAPKKKREIWLIGGTIESITGSKLPSNRQVLGRFFHHHTKDKQTIRQSASLTTKELLPFWEKARIPTRKECHIIDKIKTLHSTWQRLQRSASRRTGLQFKKEEEFKESLEDLFDVAHANALSTIKNEEDRSFLIAQREKGRRGSLGRVDRKLANVEKRKMKRKLLEEERRRRESKRVRSIAQCSREDDEHQEEDEMEERDEVEKENAVEKEENEMWEKGDDEHFLLEQNVNKIGSGPSRRKTNILTQDLTCALDRAKVSDRNATYVIAAVAQSLGYDPAELTLHKESIRKARQENREKICQEIRNTFRPDSPLTVHWDGKMLRDLMENKMVERLAVLVSGDGESKLLGVPRIPDGTGNSQAEATFQSLEDWDLCERVQSMCFDTTTSNTGHNAGACVLLENKLNRSLLSLACRHHILELVVSAVFSAVLEKTSSGTNIKLFHRFRDSWNDLDKTEYESGMTDEATALALEPIKDDIVNFIHLQLLKFQPRDDYKELLQLSLLFLGEVSEQAHIKKPGACHRARWMAKILYCLKMFLFRSQFRLTKNEIRGLREFNVFVIKVYLKVWYTCPSALGAARNDLQLLKDLVVYKDTNKPVAHAALKTFSRHLWYLSETLVPLSFFDSQVPVNIKAQMVQALGREGSEKPDRRITLDEKTISRKQLPDFVTANSREFFEKMSISQTFLQDDPNTWEQNEHYLEAQHMLKNLKVVNDLAERGVSLMQSYNAILTHQEEQKQFLFQLLEKHRKEMPLSKKSVILAALSKK